MVAKGRHNAPPHIQQRKRWYGTARWKRLRAKVLSGNPICAICWNGPATQCDHIQHTKDNARFWDIANLRPACAECNNRLGATAAAALRSQGRPTRAGGGRVAPQDETISTALEGKESDTPRENASRLNRLFQRLKEAQNAEPNDS